jgi:hypothetical protein
MDLLNLYDELEGHDDLYFWKVFIERYPLDGAIAYLIKQICSLDMDPNGPEFWAKFRAAKEVRREPERWQNDKGPIMHLNLCSKEEVREKQLDALQPLTDAMIKLMENNAMPTSLKYLVCAHLYKNRWRRGMLLFNRYLWHCGDETARQVDIDVLESAMARSRELEREWWREQAEQKMETEAETTAEPSSVKKAYSPPIPPSIIEPLQLGWK